VRISCGPVRRVVDAEVFEGGFAELLEVVNLLDIFLRTGSEVVFEETIIA
jgi:hypothetical protein